MRTRTSYPHLEASSTQRLFYIIWIIVQSHSLSSSRSRSRSLVAGTPMVATCMVMLMVAACACASLSFLTHKERRQRSCAAANDKSSRTMSALARPRRACNPMHTATQGMASISTSFSACESPEISAQRQHQLPFAELLPPPPPRTQKAP